MTTFPRLFAKTRPFLTLLVAAAPLLHSNEIKLKSSITAVTVYNDQASVTRNAKETLPAGIHTVVVTDLPWGMMDQSLKVTGTAESDVKISDIRIDQLFLDTIPESRMAELYQRLALLRDEKNGMERTSLLFKSQYDAVETMKENYVKSLSLQNPGQKASTEEWEKLLQFVERKKSDYANRMESVRKEIDQKVVKINAIEEEIRSIGGAAKKEQKQVSVTLNAPKGGTVRLEISYLIRGVSWIPTYEVRAQSTDTSLQIVYSGSVQQSSGEDWKNVDLTLSTARPAMSERLPELWRWTIDSRQVYNNNVQIRGGRSAKTVSPRPSITEPTLMGNTLSGQVIDSQSGEPLTGAAVVIEGTTLGGTTDASGSFVVYNIPAGTYNVRTSMIGYQSVSAAGVKITKTTGAKQIFYLSASNVQVGEVMVMADRPVVNKSTASAFRSFIVDGLSVDLESSVAASQFTSSTFSIPSKQTIPADNKSHKVGIAVAEIPVTLEYSVVPKMMQAAFLVARGKNSNDYPLLAGEANIFLDNSFVATVPFTAVLPNDTFSVNLGVDEGIRVERKLIGRFLEKTGTFTSKNKITFEFENVIRNFKKYPVGIVLFDHVPVSADEQYTVEIVEPDPKTMKPNADGIIPWKMKLAPNEKKEVRLKFSVEYPPDSPPHGL